MLKFVVFNDGKVPPRLPIRNAYLIGSDNSAMRAAITYEDGVIQCDKREAGVASLALQLPVGDCGELTLQTCLLPDRDDPYLLHIELARHRLMLLYNKSEDWGMFDIRSDHPVTKRVDLARKKFIEALCLQKEDPAKADGMAREALILSIDGSEELALAHADLLLNRRKLTGSLPRYVFGAGVDLRQDDNRLRSGVLANFDFLALPTPWKQLAPEEGDYHWEPMESWVKWASANDVPIIAGPLVSFESSNLPDWLFIWEHDYETVRDLIYEHIERVVNRFKDKIKVWNVVSGLHINNHFTVAFDQLMDLTRMATMVVKKVQPQAKVLVEIRQPFGEYYSQNQRSIPPMMYADLMMQGAIGFDAFVIKLMMGQATSGQFTRDLMQISHLLDQYSPFGKPVNLVVSVPSEMVGGEMIAVPDSGAPVDPNSGFWRKPWSQLVQSRWLEAMLHIALSKPYIESVSWGELVDHPEIELPLGGLVTEGLQPKAGYKRMAAFRRMLAAQGQVNQLAEVHEGHPSDEGN